MKSNPTVTGVVGAFARLGMSSERRPVLVSVLVSVWTPPLQKPFPHTRFGMEARVGIGRLGAPTTGRLCLISLAIQDFSPTIVQSFSTLFVSHFVSHRTRPTVRRPRARS